MLGRDPRHGADLVSQHPVFALHSFNGSHELQLIIAQIPYDGGQHCFSLDTTITPAMLGNNGVNPGFISWQYNHWLRDTLGLDRGG
jgi:hypothetical protein